MMKRLIKYTSLVLSIFLLCFIYTGYSIKTYATHYYEIPSDVAVVLGAGTTNGVLSNVYKERVLHAVNLFKNNKVNYIIFTGGFGKGQTISDSQVAKNFALEHGIPSNKIYIEEQSTITFYNIKYTKNIMTKYGFHTALLVSDPYHMKRSIAMCELMDLKVLPSPTPTTMYRTFNTKFKFLFRETYNYWLYLLIGQHRSVV